MAIVCLSRCSMMRCAPLRKHFSTSIKKDTLVILGTGWAGYRLAQDLDTKRFDEVHVVSARNHMVFTPLLNSAAVGTLEARSISEPVRVVFRNSNINFHLGKCQEIDVVNKKIACLSPEENNTFSNVHRFELPFDKLVVAVGANSNTFGVPGVGAGGNVYFMKEIRDATLVRSRLLECFEAASNPVMTLEERQKLLHFVVVGGGPTGVEFAAELNDFIRQDLTKYYKEVVHLARITIIEAREILGSFDQSLRDYTMRRFHKQHIEIVKGAVKQVHKEEVELADGTKIPFGLVVWSTGIGPRNFIKQLSLPKDKGGRLLVDQHLRLKDVDSVYALGDCAAVENYPLPATAQVAESQAKYLAKLLNWQAQHPGHIYTETYKYRHFASLAYIGNFRALADFTKSDLRFEKGAHKGLQSWIFWRSAYYTKLGTWRNRMQVPLDWFKTFFFGRDITRF